MQDTMVSAKGIHKAFGTNRVLRGVDLEVKHKDVLCLLGPSGSGKSTLLRCINMLETIDSGRITVDGSLIGYKEVKGRLYELTPRQVAVQRRDIGMVFQRFNLFPHMTALENIMEAPVRVRRESREVVRKRALQSLERVGLGSHKDHFPAQLSGGQQQRVALARALVMRPKVLLFDEPLSNLDAKLRVQMRNEIRRLQKRLGITSIFVTHDQDEAMTLSDRIVVMNQGRIEQIDVPERVYRHPSSIFVADFIGRANFLDATLLTEPGNGRARVFALGRERDVEAHEDVSLDGEVLLMVRPESVLLTPNPAADSVHGEVGRVLSAIFHGESVEYEVETDSGSIVALVSDPSAKEIFEPMDTVSVGIKADRGWLLPVVAEA